jgi:hypothetical protein
MNYDMEELSLNQDKKMRNIGLFLILLSIIFLILWFIMYYSFRDQNINLLLYIGIALLLGGLLIVTRLQFAIWLLEKHTQK